MPYGGPRGGWGAFAYERGSLVGVHAEAAGVNTVFFGRPLIVDVAEALIKNGSKNFKNAPAAPQVRSPSTAHLSYERGTPVERYPHLSATKAMARIDRRIV